MDSTKKQRRSQKVVLKIDRAMNDSYEQRIRLGGPESRGVHVASVCETVTPVTLDPTRIPAVLFPLIPSITYSTTRCQVHTPGLGVSEIAMVHIPPASLVYKIGRAFKLPSFVTSWLTDCINNLSITVMMQGFVEVQGKVKPGLTASWSSWTESKFGWKGPKGK